MRGRGSVVLAAAGVCVVALGVTGCGRGLRGDPWTIECLAVSGVAHRGEVEAVAVVLRQADGIRSRDVRVVHTDEASRIYYGRYGRTIDRAQGVREIPKRLREDLKLIKELVDDNGRRLFIAARMVREPLPDVGPAEWDLANADGMYTLQVAAFEPTPDRPNYKQAAVDYATLLRSKGYEAYYHHGPANSEVTVGTFGAGAVFKRDGKPTYSEEVRSLQRKENFRYNLTNGGIWHAIVDGHKAPVRSLLVRIPQGNARQP